MKNTHMKSMDHEAQRAAWASGWFMTLLKARRRADVHDEHRAISGLEALGIYIRFAEDVGPEPLSGEEAPRG